MDTRHFHDACDASAAVRLGTSTQFATASDEDNVLRVYDRSAPGAPVSRLDVTAFLAPDHPGEAEADLEGAAQSGDRIYWIGSHGRSRTGKERRTRQCLFATTVQSRDGVFTLATVGLPYTHLLRDLAAAPALRRFDLAAAAMRKPEETGGLNIEGLTAAPDGALLVGFRNPVPEGRALIVRLENPARLVDGHDLAAQVGLAAHLNLGGRGIRALEFVPAMGAYLIVAGAFDDARDFALYRWAGPSFEPAVELAVPGLNQLSPEELLVVGDEHGDLLVDLLSDDGGSGAGSCKESPPAGRRFRATSRLIRPWALPQRPTPAGRRL